MVLPSLLQNDEGVCVKLRVFTVGCNEREKSILIAKVLRTVWPDVIAALAYFLLAAMRAVVFCSPLGQWQKPSNIVTRVIFSKP